MNNQGVKSLRGPRLEHEENSMNLIIESFKMREQFESCNGDNSSDFVHEEKGFKNLSKNRNNAFLEDDLNISSHPNNAYSRKNKVNFPVNFSESKEKEKSQTDQKTLKTNSFPLNF
jgi:hypothetical protein